MKIVVNRCFGGFGLSDAAYERLAELGVPIQGYVEQERGEDGRYLEQPANDGEVIFDRRLSGKDDFEGMSTFGRYWETWIDSETRNHPLLVQVVEELGEAANGSFAKLEVVEIPDGTPWEISEYDGSEHIAEKHRIWESKNRD